MTIEELNDKTERIHTIIHSHVIKYRKEKGSSQLQFALRDRCQTNAHYTKIYPLYHVKVSIKF